MPPRERAFVQERQYDLKEISPLAAERLSYVGIQDAVFILGHVRSATTSMERMIVASRRPAIYQPVKALLRRIVAGQEPGCINLLEEATRIVEQHPPLKGADPTHIVVKETAGLKTELESDMSYFGIHQDLAEAAGAKLRVLLTARHPASAYHSCVRTYRGALEPDELDRLFLRSQNRFYQQVEEVRKSGLPHVLVAHGLLDTSQKDQQGVEALAWKIMNGLGISRPEHAPPISYRWPSLSPENGYNPALSGIFFPPEPGMTKLNDIAHERVMRSTRLGIGTGDVNGATLIIKGYEEECAEISKLHADFHQESSRQLGFSECPV